MPKKGHDEKRRDSKGRILRSGESQRYDGRYAYKYNDVFGKPQFVYSWRLVPTDKSPAGKREDLSLREKIKQIQKDLDDGIYTVGGKITVSKLHNNYIHLRNNIKQCTKNNDMYWTKILSEEGFGGVSVDSVKTSDAKRFLVQMNIERGLSYATLNAFKSSMSAAFQLAVQDDYIRKNPFDFPLKSIVTDNRKRILSLSLDQKESLLDFIQNSNRYKKYYDEFIIFLETGLRVSELCGLTEDSIDFNKGIITVKRQLLRDHRNSRLYIETPKTESGYRMIPMSPLAYSAMKRCVKKIRNKSYTIDGCGGFIFFTQKGTPRTTGSYDILFRGILKKYNESNRIPIEKMTPHVLRHTFCTIMANSGMNPKALQYIMGHSNIDMTLNHYADTTFETAQEEMLKMVARSNRKKAA